MNVTVKCMVCGNGWYTTTQDDQGMPKQDTCVYCELMNRYGTAQPDKHAQRKATPIYRGVIKYFPLAIAEVAKCSQLANEQHNPGTEMHWDRSKSGDELDALARHLMDAGTMDDDGIRHSTKVAWRALANLQKELEAESE